MPNATILENLDVFLSRSQNLLALANNNNWDDFEHLQKQRDANLDQIGQALDPSALHDSTLIQSVRARLQEITTINKALVLLANKNKASAKKQLKGANHAQKAMVAYKK